jgi:hypothetical protein
MPFAPFSLFKLKFVGNETFIFHTTSDGFSVIPHRSGIHRTELIDVFLTISISHFGTIYH